jgi:carbamoyl-phosphate synthase large subunit
LIVQQAVQGEEYGIDVINDLERRYVCTFVEHKLAMRAGETDSAEIVDAPSLVDFGQRIGSMGLHPGVLDLDVIVDGDAIRVIEMNPRFGGHYPFAHMAGADVPAALIAWARHEQPNPAWLRAEAGVRGYKELRPMRTAVATERLDTDRQSPDHQAFSELEEG